MMLSFRKGLFSIMRLRMGRYWRYLSGSAPGDEPIKGGCRIMVTSVVRVQIGHFVHHQVVVRKPPRPGVRCRRRKVNFSAESLVGKLPVVVPRQDQEGFIPLVGQVVREGVVVLADGAPWRLANRWCLSGCSTPSRGPCRFCAYWRWEGRWKDKALRGGYSRNLGDDRPAGHPPRKEKHYGSR